jgi:hypothetical protein
MQHRLAVIIKSFLAPDLLAKVSPLAIRAAAGSLLGHHQGHQWSAKSWFASSRGKEDELGES